jgi:hypothetical protein
MAPLEQICQLSMLRYIAILFVGMIASHRDASAVAGAVSAQGVLLALADASGSCLSTNTGAWQLQG